MSEVPVAQTSFYAGLLDWVLEISTGSPLLVGINGPQGAGKSTLAAALCEGLGRRGKRAFAVSIDDFYLTREHLLRLSADYPANPYFQQRGYPGTHDVELGERVLRALRRPEAGKVRVPRYDKSAHGGHGDRRPEAEWSEAETPLDVAFLEGWMLGFRPVRESLLPNVDFFPVNRALAEYSRWDSLLDAFLQLVPQDPGFVVDWRAEAEEKTRASGRPGLSDAEIRAYAAKFLPAYETYLPGLAASPPPARHLLRVEIGKNRLPLPGGGGRV